MSTDVTYPGESLGLPASGPGSLASWGRRIAALVGDWALAMALAYGLIGAGVVTSHGGSWWIMLLFFVQRSLMTILTGGSIGQLIARIGVVRLDGSPLGWWRPIVRTLMICFVIPAVVIGAERRSLSDLMLGTVVVHRV